MVKTMKASVRFYQCIQDSQEYGSNDEHMISRVFFNMNIGDTTYKELFADIKQTVGSSFETGSIEVSKPIGYKGPINYGAFRDAAEKYFRTLVGSQASGIRIEGGAKNIRMMNNTFNMEMSAEFYVDVI